MKYKGGTLDIESFPGTWRTFANNTYEANLISEVTPNMPASFSFKPTGGRPITRGVWQFDTPEEFMKALWDVFDQNDYIIGHNVKRFDRTQSNTFFAQFGLPAPSDCKFPDTMTAIKARFRLPSYSLKYCLRFFKIGQKMETGGDSLWIDAEEGDEKAQAKMLRYNQNDTVQTEKLWNFLVDNGWARLPVIDGYKKGMSCPRCLCIEWQKRGIKPIVGKGLCQYYSCKRCNKQMPGEIVEEWTTLKASVVG
jgi:hypothetical protein